MIEIQPQTGVPHSHTVAWRQLEPGVYSSLQRLQKGDRSLTMEDLKGLLFLAKESCTVSLAEPSLVQDFPWLTKEQAREVLELARVVQRHSCVASCNRRPTQGQECSHFYPRLPSLFTIVARIPNITSAERRQDFMESVERLQSQVQEQLRRLQRAGQLASFSLCCVLDLVDPSHPEGCLEDGYSWGGLTVTPGPDLTHMYEQCSFSPGFEGTQWKREKLICYHWSLLYRSSPRVIHQRTVKEVFIVSYNPAVLLSTRANHEVELVTSTPSKVFQYVTKGGAGPSNETTKVAISVLEERGEMELARRVEDMVDVQNMREVTLPEACYRLNESLQLSASNTLRVFTNVDLLGNKEGQSKGEGEDSHEDDRGDVEKDKEVGDSHEEEEGHEDSDEEEESHDDRDEEVLAQNYNMADYSMRPALLESLTYAQWKMFYRRSKQGAVQGQPQVRKLVPVVTPADLPALPHLPPPLLPVHLPQLIPVRRPDSSTVTYHLMKTPRVLDWMPLTTYSDIFFFKVRQL